MTKKSIETNDSVSSHFILAFCIFLVFVILVIPYYQKMQYQNEDFIQSLKGENSKISQAIDLLKEIKSNQILDIRFLYIESFMNIQEEILEFSDIQRSLKVHIQNVFFKIQRVKHILSSIDKEKRNLNKLKSLILIKKNLENAFLKQEELNKKFRKKIERSFFYEPIIKSDNTEITSDQKSKEDLQINVIISILKEIRSLHRNILINITTAMKA